MEIKQGDTVQATKYLWRYDFACSLSLGKRAKVLHVFEGSRDGVQIVDIELADGNRMIDIVVENGIPLEVVTTVETNPERGD